MQIMAGRRPSAEAAPTGRGETSAATASRPVPTVTALLSSGTIIQVIHLIPGLRYVSL